MKRFFFLMLFFLSVGSSAQNATIKPLTMGEIHTLHSSVLSEDRTLNIALPAQFDATMKYPVVYVLDGTMNEDFLHIAGLVQFFNLMFSMPDCIVVGIANVDRKRDFTFHTDLADLKEAYPTTGHSEKFMQFLETELVPYINQKFKTDGTRYLIGQSLGGLVATEILLKKPSLFTHYLITSPSLWWDNESLLAKAPSLVKSLPENELYVYLAVGKKEDKIMVREAQKLFELLKSSGKKKLKTNFNLMDDENHATILHRSVYDAFLNLFPYKD